MLEQMGTGRLSKVWAPQGQVRRWELRVRWRIMPCTVSSVAECILNQVSSGCSLSALFLPLSLLLSHSSYLFPSLSAFHFPPSFLLLPLFILHPSPLSLQQPKSDLPHSRVTGWKNSSVSLNVTPYDTRVRGGGRGGQLLSALLRLVTPPWVGLLLSREKDHPSLSLFPLHFCLLFFPPLLLPTFPIPPCFHLERVE